MSVIHAPRKPEIDARMIAFPAAMLAVLLVLFFRLWYFQVVKAQELVERADATRSMPIPKPAPRGLIYDRNNELVAGVQQEIVITARPEIVAKNIWVLEKTAKILGVDLHKIEKKYRSIRDRKFVSSPIFVGASIQAGTQIAECADELPGIGVESRPMRYYPDSVSFAHVMGYVWVPSKDDVASIEKTGKTPADYVGKLGIERAYEDELMGEPGADRVEIDAKRRPIRLVGRDNATPGNRLTLTLDAPIQKLGTRLMSENKYVGGIVALDPRNGEVLCLVSGPTFDQRMFQGGISDEELKQLYSDPNHPLIDRAIRSAYSPGSTFKMVTSLAAYERGQFDPHRVVYCGGAYWLNHHSFKCLGHHGDITYADALEKSCNTYFATIGHDAGEDALRKASLEFGLGDKEGIDIGGELSGDVPTEKYMEKRHRKWYGGDTVNFSIGQGYVTATPLQMANVMAMVATSGTSYKPHLIQSIHDQEGRVVERFEPEVLHHIDASPEFWHTMQTALIGVVDEGTAQSAKIQGLSWAGKTGSTEHGKGKVTHSWFVGYAPADNPRIAIAVLVENGGHGGTAAAPVAKQLVQNYLFRKRPAASSNALASRSASAALSGAPSVR